MPDLSALIQRWQGGDEHAAELATELRGVHPSIRMSFAAIAPHLKRSRRITMVLKQSNQFVYGALTMALLVAVGAGLYFFVSNLSRPTPTTLEEVKQTTAVPTAAIKPTAPAATPKAVISQPTINPSTEVSQLPASPVELILTITGDPNPLSGPISVAADSQDNLYVVDANNARIQKFDPNGQFLAMWGRQGAGDGEFSFTFGGSWYGGVAVDGQGQVYVADPINKRIQKFDSNGQFLTKWGSFGAGDDQFSQPAGAAVDGEGNVYVADYGNNRIQKFRQK